MPAGTWNVEWSIDIGAMSAPPVKKNNKLELHINKVSVSKRFILLINFFNL